MKSDNSIFIVHFSGRIASFFSNLNRSKSLSSDAIHDLRVDIKNIRALLKALSPILDSNKVLPLLKQLKPLFRRAGELRTTELNMKMLSDYSFSEANSLRSIYKNQLKLCSTTYKKELSSFNAAVFNKRIRSIEKILRNFTDKDFTEILKGFFKKGIKKIKSFERDRIKDQTALHDIRKKLKEIKSALKLLMALHPDYNFKSSYTIVTKNEERIGNWHDKVVFYNWLKEISASEKLSERQKIKTLTEKIHKEVRVEASLLRKNKFSKTS